jgi:hypothetical protein
MENTFIVYREASIISGETYSNKRSMWARRWCIEVHPV